MNSIAHPPRLPPPKVLLQQHHLRAKDSWGQNFLANDEVLEAIADACQLSAGQCCVELGAGLGHLTQFLVSTGAEVCAVERDRDLVPVLESYGWSRCRIVAADASTVRFAEVSGRSRVVVAGNLPYHLTSTILFSLIEQRSAVERAVFTIQREVAERISAGPGSRVYGLLSVLLARVFSVETVRVLPASHFFPRPKVESAVVALQARPETSVHQVPDERRFTQVVKAAFAHRRKTLANSLRDVFSTLAQGELAKALQRADVDGTRRAETLAVEEFVRLDSSLGPLLPAQN